MKKTGGEKSRSTVPLNGINRGKEYLSVFLNFTKKDTMPSS
jgi:hypothetical protein